MPFELRSACYVKLLMVRELNINAATQEILVCLMLFVVCTWNRGLRGLDLMRMVQSVLRVVEGVSQIY